MRSLITFISVILLILSSLAHFNVADPSINSGIVASRNFISSDGLNWSDPVKVTTNSVDDMYPSIAVDDNGMTYIVYYQNSQNFMFQKYQRNGAIAVKETLLQTGYMIFQKPAIGTKNAQPVKYFDLGYNDISHLLWGESPQKNFQYQRFTGTGKPLSTTMYPDVSLSYTELAYLEATPKNYAFFGLTSSMSGENSYLSRMDLQYDLLLVNVGSDAEGITLSTDKWNQASVHVFTRSSTSTGIFHIKFTTDQQRVITQHEIFKGIINGTGLDSPMPSTTISPNGHVHFLLYSQTASPRTIYYAETDKDGNPLLGGHAITVTKDAGDYGDIASDNKGNIIIVWGNANDGQVYYTKVVDGKENESLAKSPIQISTGLAGNSSSPKIAIDHHFGLHVVFVNDVGGDKEVIYRYAYPFAFELLMDPNEQARMMFIEDGELKSGNFSLKNVGGQSDAIALNVTYEISDNQTQGWKAWIENASVELEMDAFLKLKVFVQAPEIANFGAYLEVCVNARGHNHPETNASICFKSFFIQSIFISITCDEETHLISAGDSTKYTCEVWNKGDITEDILIKNIDSPEDWAVNLSQDTFKAIKKWEKIVFFVNLTAPKWAMANEGATVTLEASYVSLPIVHAIAVLRALIAPNLSLQLKSDDSIRYVNPGERAEFNLSVYNDGNLRTEVVLSLASNNNTNYWNPVLDKEYLEVSRGTYEQFNVMVVAPLDAYAGSSLLLTVWAKVNGTEVQSHFSLLVIVKTVHKIWVNVKPSTIAIKPGDMANYDVDLINTGNLLEIMTYEPQHMEPGWLFGINNSRLSVDKIFLGMDESQRMCVTLYIPSNATAGLYDIAIILKDSSDYNVTFHITVKILQIYPIEMDTSVGRKNGTPNGVVSFDLDVTNQGNGQDLINLTLVGPPLYWIYHFEQKGSPVTNITLKTKAKATVQIFLQIPSSNKLDAYHYLFHILATSSGGYKTWADVTIDLQLANLLVGKITYNPTRMVSKHNVLIQVEIKNYGYTSCDNVSVQFFDGNTLAGETVVDRMLIRNDKIVIFNWIPTAGTHTLKFFVDSKNTTFEFNEDDNIQINKVTVLSSSLPQSHYENILPLLIIPIIISVAIVLGRRK